jgi:glycosyltransferase involved in cell wall biosynthesis
LRIFRCLRPPFVRSVNIGPSLAKVPLDGMLTLCALRRALTRRYDAIHSHEEGGLIGVVLAAALRVPHVYDMHSSLPQQLANFAFGGAPIVGRLFRRIERLIVRRSRVVIAICPSLEETVREIDPAAQVIVIENAPGSDEGQGTPAQATAVRKAFGLAGSTPLVLYAGTFEVYQGLDLLLASMALVRARRPDARLLLAGGKPDQVLRLREQAQEVGVADITLFAGERPASEIPGYLLAADVLVSPRSRGTNTPLKIYQYLRTGKAIVATRLLTHTQVLGEETAFLTGVSAAEYADGILTALENPVLAAAVGRRARELAETKYSYEAYLERTRRACSALARSEAPVAPGKDVKDVA